MSEEMEVRMNDMNKVETGKLIEIRNEGYMRSFYFLVSHKKKP